MKNIQFVVLVVALISFFTFAAISDNVYAADLREAPSTQVVNSSGMLLDKVMVGKVSFSKNLNYCADGCSTGFKNVSGGSNIIAVKASPTSSWVKIGSLAGFAKSQHYSVNMARRGSQVCAELYTRSNTDRTFNDDRGKRKVADVCRGILLPAR